jgi:hypothetical protein
MSRPNRPNPQVVARAMARDLMRHFELTEFAHPVREIQRNQIFAIEILALKCGWFELSEELEQWRNQAYENERQEHETRRQAPQG